MSKLTPYPLPTRVKQAIDRRVGGITIRTWKRYCHRSLRHQKVAEKKLLQHLADMQQHLDDVYRHW